jgi:peptide/nickel transport system substrate-binding protein
MFKRNVRRKAAVAVVAAAAIVTLAACSSSSVGGSTNSSSSKLGVITVGQTADVQSLDPVIDNSLQGINVYDTLYDTLTQLKRNGDVIPRLATSWTSNSNATEWDVKLTNKAKFSNGDPVTAADVIYTYRQVQTNPKSLNSSYLSSVKSMTAVGKYEVKFDLSTPFANWPRQMTLLSIVPEKVYKADGGSAGFAKDPIGSGPYTFVSYKSGVSLVVKRNPNYWGPKATLSQITFVPVLTDQSRVSGVQSGSLDLALIPPTSVSTLKGSGAVDVRNVGGNQTMYLGFNSSSGETANAKIREAISLAVDRPAIVKSILGGLGVPANQLSSPKNFGYDASRKAIPYDPTKAKALLKEAGYSGQPIPLQYATDGWIPLGSQVAQAIGGYMQKVGINVQMQGTDAASFNLLNSKKAYTGVYFTAYGPSYLDAQIILNFGIGPNATRYFTNSNIDTLYNQQISETNPTKRAAYIAKIWDVIDENTYFGPVYDPEFSYAVNPKLKWTPWPDGSLFFEGATLSK